MVLCIIQVLRASTPLHTAHTYACIMYQNMPTRGAISQVIVNLALVSDKYVQNSYHPLGLIDIIILFGSIRMLSRALYLIFNQRFNPFLPAALLYKYQ